MATEYKCPNLGNCDKADKGERIRLPDSGPHTCPECGSRLTPAPGGNGGAGKGLLLGGVSAVLALLGGLFWYLNDRPPECEPPLVWNMVSKACEPATPVPCTLPEVYNPKTNSCQAPPECMPPAVLDPATRTCQEAPVVAETLLRFHGSNTIGGKLLPALAEAFLRQEGYANVHRVDGAKE